MMKKILSNMKLLHNLMLKLGYRPTHWTDSSMEELYHLYQDCKPVRLNHVRSGQIKKFENKFEVTLSVKKIKK